MNEKELVIPVFESVEKLQKVFGKNAKFLRTDTCESSPTELHLFYKGAGTWKEEGTCNIGAVEKVRVFREVT